MKGHFDSHHPRDDRPGARSGTPTNVALTIARAIDQRLHATVEDPLHLPLSRLYGCTIHDDDVRTGGAVADLGAAVRFTFLGEAPLVYDLLGGPLGIVVRAFDAAAVVSAGWGAPLETDGSISSRPSRHPDRFRILVCTVVGDDGIASVVRNETDPDTPIELAERGIGMLPDMLELMWMGDLGAVGDQRPVNDPAACSRRPARPIR